MPIKLVLSVALGGLLAYASVQRAAPRSVRLGTTLVIAIGVYFVWMPEHTTVVANWLGVGRGADLVIYVWILLSFAVGLSLNFKVRSLRREVTDLARALALLTVRGPDGAMRTSERTKRETAGDGGADAQATAREDRRG